MLRVNPDRFLQNLAELAQIGRLSDEAGGGLDRRPFSPAARAAGDYFHQQAEIVGLELHLDGAANLSARLPGHDGATRTLLLGSHLDTVPNGGAYDGALGVIAALEVLRTVQEAGLSLPLHLEAIAFTDEEGRFGDFFGSRALAGGHSQESIAAFLAQAGCYPEDLAAMRQRVPGGLSPAGILAARRQPQALAGFIELHIEQGPQLERAGLPIGVVDAIFGRRSMQVQFLGRSDHAGTTPLPLRADALVAAAQFIVQAPQLVQRRFPQAVLTCGQVQVKPGVANVVPQEALVQVEFRAGQVETLTRLSQDLWDLAAASCAGVADLSFQIHAGDRHDPVPMSQDIQVAIHQASQRLDQPYMALSSGALHDAGVLAALIPSGLIFVPSRGGRSHCPDEETAAVDLVAGANQLLHTVLILSQAEEVKTA